MIVEYCVGSERKTVMRIGKDMHHKGGIYAEYAIDKEELKGKSEKREGYE